MGNAAVLQSLSSRINHRQHHTNVCLPCVRSRTNRGQTPGAQHEGYARAERTAENSATEAETASHRSDRHELSVTACASCGRMPAEKGAHVNTNRYILDQAWQRERERLKILGALSDPFTIRHLEALGVRSGWRCAEVGAGAGSIARWLAERVGDTGQIVATDLDTRFLDDLDDLNRPNVEIRRHDIVAEPLEADSYDLIHTRYLLMHLPERGRALDHLVRAVRPGGWLLVEDGDFRNYQRSYPPSAPVEATGAAIFKLLERGGADPQYGFKLLPALADGGLINLGVSATQGILSCGSEKVGVFTLLLAHLQNALVSTGLATANEVEAAIEFLQTPSATTVYGTILVSAWGQRPSN